MIFMLSVVLLLALRRLHRMARENINDLLARVLREGRRES